MDTVTTTHQRIRNLIPSRSATLRGESLAVCTPLSEAPEYLRTEHRDRHVAYMRTGDRISPSYGPRYVVTYKGILIAWVTLDGRPHFRETAELREEADRSSVRLVDLIRHQRETMRSWPVRFELDSQGDPVGRQEHALPPRPSHEEFHASSGLPVPSGLCARC